MITFLKSKLLYFILILTGASGLWMLGGFPKVGVMGPVFFPRLVFMGMIFLCVLLIMQKKLPGSESGDLRRAASIIGAALLFLISVLAMQYIHFSAGALGFLFLFMRIMGGRSLAASLVISAIGVGCLMAPMILFHIPM